MRFLRLPNLCVILHSLFPFLCQRIPAPGVELRLVTSDQIRLAERAQFIQKGGQEQDDGRKDETAEPEPFAHLSISAQDVA